MLPDKLNKFFTSHGLQKKWFADNLGMSQTQLTLILTGKNTVPHKYWSKMIELTGGEITLADLIQDKLKRIECIEIAYTKTSKSCRISLRNVNKTL